MIVRQLYYQPTSGYTYLLADLQQGEGILIDPVKTRMRDYVQLFNELGLTLTAAVETHSHDDRESARADLQALWNCETIIGGPAETADYTRVVQHGDIIAVGELRLEVLHTPGHTIDSYCFYLRHPDNAMVFTGETLLIRSIGTGNQPSSNPRQHFHSLYRVLANLPEDTIVYPGRDFKGWSLSTIREEKAFNPYLQAENLEEFLNLKARQTPAETPVSATHEGGAVSEPAGTSGRTPGEKAVNLPGSGRLRSIDENIDSGGNKLPSWR